MMTEERGEYSTALVAAPEADGMSLMQLGDVLSRSGYFQDSKSAAQAIVKVLAGRELGIGPIASMTGIHIIQGRVSVGANVIAAKVKGSKRYDFHTRELTNETAVIDFYERNYMTGKSELIGTSTFTAADAKAAGTKNMGAFPRNMLFARAMSNGVKWYCPDISVAPMYTPDELGATVDYETGEIIDAPATAPETTVTRREVNETPTKGNGKTEPKRAAIEARFGEVVGQLAAIGQDVNVDDAWIKAASDAELIAEGKRLAGVLATAQAAQAAMPLEAA